jgi:hypothetical protein
MPHGAERPLNSVLNIVDTLSRMTADAKHLVDESAALPDPSKREVLAQLLRIARGIDYPEIGDDELTGCRG